MPGNLAQKQTAIPSAINAETTIVRSVKRTEHIVGLDSLRFLAAVVVAISHVGLYQPAFIAHLGVPGNLLLMVLRNFINGPAAVIVFFVISGFCIHLPHRGQKSVSLFNYFIRRYLRIGIPFLVILNVNALVGNTVEIRYSILWSVVAELVYYTIYPGLLRLRSRFGWMSLLWISAALAFGVVLRNPRALNYPSYGDNFNWLLGLPCWLLGCRLAETMDQFKLISRSRMWGWRIGLGVVSMVTLVVRFHAGIGYPWTLNFFAVLIYFWLGREILYFRAHKPLGWLEWCGRATYSLYLVHLPAANIATRLGASDKAYYILYPAVALATCLFYGLVEKPSHWLAKYFGKLVTARTLPARPDSLPANRYQ